MPFFLQSIEVGASGSGSVRASGYSSCDKSGIIRPRRNCFSNSSSACNVQILVNQSSFQVLNISLTEHGAKIILQTSCSQSFSES